MSTGGRDLERIAAIVAEAGRRYEDKGGGIEFAGVDSGTVKVAPAGFCWR